MSWQPCQKPKERLGQFWFQYVTLKAQIGTALVILGRMYERAGWQWYVSSGILLLDEEGRPRVGAAERAEGAGREDSQYSRIAILRGTSRAKTTNDRLQVGIIALTFLSVVTWTTSFVRSRGERTIIVTRKFSRPHPAVSQTDCF